MEENIIKIGLSLLPSRNKTESQIVTRSILQSFDSDNIAGKTDVKYDLEPGGRPFFPDNHADFSISHSRNMAAIAYLSALNPGSIHKIGCDIQYADPRKNFTGISREFFHYVENDYIFSGIANDRYFRFYILWTLKEAWLKKHGLSVFDMKQAPAFINDDSLGNHDFKTFVWRLESDNGEYYMLAVITESQTGSDPCIEWFSQERLSITPVKIFR